MSSEMTNASTPKDRDGVDQDQFLTILSRDDALARFEAALFPRAIPSEPRALADALGCALAQDIVAPIDVPPFDRSNVDGFAVRSADLASASEATPVRVMLNDEVIACGTAPTRPVLSGTATSIATGGPLPRGAHIALLPGGERQQFARAIAERTFGRGQRFQPRAHVGVGRVVDKQKSGPQRGEILDDLSGSPVGGELVVRFDRRLRIRPRLFSSLT